MQAERTITSIKSISGNLTMDTSEINENFMNYYINHNIKKTEKTIVYFLISCSLTFYQKKTKQLLIVH